jgi:1-deoxy-D-xylulose-5-phosphate reductoisomerase
LRAGGAAPTILNAANEIAVASFLGERVGFLDIARIVEETLAAMPAQRINSLDDVFAIDATARRKAERAILSTPFVA